VNGAKRADRKFAAFFPGRPPAAIVQNGVTGQFIKYIAPGVPVRRPTPDHGVTSSNRIWPSLDSRRQAIRRVVERRSSPNDRLGGSRDDPPHSRTSNWRHARP
jgi:hypothetical protein